MSHTLGNFELAPQDWSTLRRLLTEALALPGDERAPWLDRLPEPERRFAGRLRALLAHADDSAALLDTPPRIETGTFAAPLSAGDETLAAPGRRVGPYRLLAPLGEGGMASVWLAERDDLLQSRRVALKLPHGAWRQSVWAERLAREREILGTLSHPNIAALYDAGIDDGRPWLALEYVEGVPLDEHCGTQALEPRERLALFLQVTDAVAHAHARLVVHRDLKPSNILVRADGQVRLLDFGIAKLLEQGEARETALTRETGRALTPDYAAPEQIAGRPIGTAADVYSLGVLLYELLAGTRPYRLKRGSRAELEEAIVAAEPLRPSDVAADARRCRQLRGDLDTIVMKALKKSPGERYGSVVELAEDIRRHLDGQPVRAQPDRWTYRSAKFIARHRVAVATGALALGALVGGAGLALWQGYEARLQQRRAEQVKDLLAGLFREADPYGGAGRTLSAVELLQQATRRIDAAVPELPALRIELLTLVGASLLNLEDTAAAEPVIERAVAHARANLPPSHALALQAQLQQLHVLRVRGRTAQMEHQLRVLEPVVIAHGTSRDQVQLRTHVAHFAIDAGRYAEAEAAAHQALEQALAAFGPRDTATLEAAMLVALAGLYGARPPAEALPAATRAYELVRSAYADRPRHPRLIDMRHIHGRALANAGRLAEGIAQIRRAADDAEAVFGRSSRLLGYILGNLARYERAAGDLGAALGSSSRSLAIHREHSQDESYTVAGGLTARGVILLAAERPADAVPDLSASVATLTRLFGPDHIETLIARFNLGLAIGLSGRRAEGLAAVQQALHGYRMKYADEQVRPLLALARLQRESGRASDALRTLEDALAQAGGARATALDRAQVQAELGLSLLATGRTADAVEPLQRALALFGEHQTHRTPLAARVQAALEVAAPARARAAPPG